MVHFSIYLCLKLCLMGVAVYLTAWLLPGVHVRSLRIAIMGGVVYSILQVFLGLLALGLFALLLGPVGVVFGSLFGILSSAALLWLMSVIVIGIDIDGYRSAIAAAVVLWVVNLGLYFALGI